MDGNFLKSLAIEMSTKMSHFVKESNRKTMLLNGATSTLELVTPVTNSDPKKYSIGIFLTSFLMTRSVLLRMVSI